MKNLYSVNIKKYKNVLCLVGLILLGFFILKHFNLIEGMSDDTTSTTDISLPKGKDGGEEGDRYGDGNYTVHVNIQAPKMANLNPSSVTEQEDTSSTSTS